MSLIPELDHLKIPIEDIKTTTNNFADDNFIGEGGFGKVYKGQLQLLSASHRGFTNVAVKRLDMKSVTGQGQHEFLMEIFMLSSYKHDNLASLVGFSEEGDEKIVVYEHEVRGSLDKYLANTDLTWLQRLQICLGAAHGLNYLHSGVAEGHRVLHRDIKSSNILLDDNWVAKISDFGLSKIGPTNQQYTFLVTHVAGTYAYMDPAYLTTGILTKESDVYSFGVVLFEVLCGRLATINYNNANGLPLPQLAKDRYEEGKLDEIIVPSIRKQMKPNSLQTFCSIAYQCLKPDRKQRPTMALVVEHLQISLEFQTGSRTIEQTRLWGSSTGGSPWSLQLDNNQKLKKITIDHDNWIYSIGFTTQYFSGSADSSQYYGQYGGHGGPSDGTISEINFDDDEEITEIHGTIGVSTGRYPHHTVISSLSFVTNKKSDGATGDKLRAARFSSWGNCFTLSGLVRAMSSDTLIKKKKKKKNYGPFGRETGTPFSVSWDVGSLGGFYGRHGFYLDGLGFYLKDTIQASI